MEKNRIRPITNGKSSRMRYSRQKEVLEMPNLIEVQKNSYEWFLGADRLGWRHDDRILSGRGVVGIVAGRQAERCRARERTQHIAQ